MYSQQVENKLANSLQVLLVLWFKYKDSKGLHVQSLTGGKNKLS